MTTRLKGRQKPDSIRDLTPIFSPARHTRGGTISNIGAALRKAPLVSSIPLESLDRQRRSLFSLDHRFLRGGEIPARRNFNIVVFRLNELDRIAQLVDDIRRCITGDV